MGIEDKRQEWKVVHQLLDIVVIVLFATLGNADDWPEIEIFARNNEGVLRRYIGLLNGVPSHDTIQRVMSSIKPEVFEGLQRLWNELLNRGEGEKLKKILNIDGKTMRGNANKNQEALHVVTAWSKEGGVCFGQKAVNGKGKEIPAIKDLLEIISVKQQVVTIDAIGTQTEIVAKIRNGKGDYVLAVKGNQANLHEDIRTYFEDEEFLTRIKEQQGYRQTIEKAHGQIEIREYYQTDHIAWLPGREQWKGLKTIGMSRNTYKKDGKETTSETRYYISSLSPDIALFQASVRGHWAVESMHWHLDVTFREDHNQTLDKTAAQNLNIIRKWALSILKLVDLGKSYSLKKKRFALGCGSGFSKYVDALMAL
jgi:predicted transposase YbfD/YdcC